MNTPLDISDRENVARRPFLIGLTSIGLLGTVSTVNSTDDDEKSDDDASADPADHHRLDQAFAWDADFDFQLTNRMQLDGDPAESGREHVVHITSHGQESADYPTSAVDLQDRSLTLGDVEAAGSLTYDYYKGKEATYRVPDEVFLIVRHGQDLSVTYRKRDTEDTGVWETRDVSSEFTQDGWRTIHLEADDVDVKGERVQVSTKVIGNYFMEIREQDSSQTLFEQFDAETELLAVAIGNGSIEGVVSDAYFHNLYVSDQEYVFPAMLTMDAEFTPPRVQPGEGQFTATLSFANSADEAAVSLEAIDAESVQLAPFGSITPPVPGTDEADQAVSATELRPTGRGLDVVFDASAVADVITGETTVCVSGAFEMDEPYTFAALGDLEVAGRSD
ncbi:hypothetical protein [Natronosalvus caseinilyticus]|uniref:hypothetical protein n=1 Tax=Natronosalvus caseinilyticus TaxID=2953747 RepID=UPI0028B13ABA|nr:hypothetical protein [Natronosalvus caseinilyticus]